MRAFLLLLPLLAACDLGLSPLVVPDPDRPGAIRPPDVTDDDEPVALPPVPADPRKITVKFRHRPDVNLGVALYPPGVLDDLAVRDWKVPGAKPATWGVAYSLSDAAAKRLRARYGAYLESIGYERRGGDTYFDADVDCANNSCALRALAKLSREPLKPLAALFRQQADARKLTKTQLAAAIVGYVQSLKYRIPKREPFGIEPPPFVVTSGEGDCDSRSLLAAVLLELVGIDAILLSSESARHTVLGVEIPPVGTYFEVRKKRYVYVETTSAFDLGEVPKEDRRVNDWSPVILH